MHSHPPAPQAESEAARIRAAAELEAALAARDRVTAEQLAARDRAIAEQKVEITRLKAIAEPTKARFKKGNHFNAETDLAVIQVLALGLARLDYVLKGVNPGDELLARARVEVKGAQAAALKHLEALRMLPPVVPPLRRHVRVREQADLRLSRDFDLPLSVAVVLRTYVTRERLVHVV